MVPQYLGKWVHPARRSTIPYTASHTDAMSYRNKASVTVQDNEGESRHRRPPQTV